MRIIESEQFGEMAEKSAEILREHGRELEASQKVALEINVRRGRVHRGLERILGGAIAVANDAGANVGGFIATDSKKIHITEAVLDDASLAEKVIRHENKHREHLSAGISEVNFKRELKPWAYPLIAGYMQKYGHDIDEIDFIEGFTEACTARRHGKNDDCSYNAKEVPAVEALEMLCRNELGQSVINAFDCGNIDLVYELLESAAGVTAVKERLAVAA
jgi:hypothetical protein